MFKLVLRKEKMLSCIVEQQHIQPVQTDPAITGEATGENKAIATAADDHSGNNLQGASIKRMNRVRIIKQLRETDEILEDEKRTRTILKQAAVTRGKRTRIEEGKNMSIEDTIKAVKHCAISTLLVVTRSRAAKDLVMQLDYCYVPCK